jgi:hypothetical protein
VSCVFQGEASQRGRQRRCQPLGHPGSLDAKEIVMSKQELSPAPRIQATEQTAEVYREGYRAPQMFAVGQTVELIQGGLPPGPYDGRTNGYVFRR